MIRTRCSLALLVFLFLPLWAYADEGRTLILYDHAGEEGGPGELYAIQMANMVSHFGERDVMPLSLYQQGQASDYRVVIYLGHQRLEEFPSDFLEDIRETQAQVLWIGENIWHLDNKKNMSIDYGFRPTRYNREDVVHIHYKNRELPRSGMNSDLINIAVRDNTPVEILASAQLESGHSIPWALRNGRFLYVAEIPFNYVTENDRYLAFSDLLFDVYDPEREARHRAIVRLEDISPATPPEQLYAFADMLHDLEVPFTIAAFPKYVDPGGGGGGKPLEVYLHERPRVIEALLYAIERGGEIIVHGYTHQYRNFNNPYSGESVGDYEFFLADIDEDDNVILKGPVPSDSYEWARRRGEKAIEGFMIAGVPVTDIFEYPHYAGTGVTSRALAEIFPYANHRGLYFSGSLDGKNENTDVRAEQVFHYPVRDVFNWKHVPENMGHFVPWSYHGRSARGIEEMLETAQNIKVIRDSIAGFFYHMNYGTDRLKFLIEEMQREGFEFIPTTAVEDPEMEGIDFDHF